MQHQPHATDAPAVLKISEVIHVMRISRTAAYEGARNFLRTDGAVGIPCVRVGRSIRFPRLLLENYLKQPITADQLIDTYETNPPITNNITTNTTKPNTTNTPKSTTPQLFKS
jgi:hypothetical protein